jgi:Aspartyl/Asparaginyl beta-hydroxylase
MNNKFMPQAIYRRNEILVGDYLMSIRQELIDEYMEGYNSLEEAIMGQSLSVLDRRYWGVPLSETEHLIKTKDSTGKFVPNVNAWQAGDLKYKYDPLKIKYDLDPQSFKVKKWKTACKLIEEFGDDCPTVSYNAMFPNTVLGRHAGHDDPQGLFIRVHIPLIIPQGDVFLEINGEEIKWDDCFGFNHQIVHSSHNYTNEYRLIFLIDFRRSRLGIPDAPYDTRLNILANPFKRKCD